MPTNVQIPALGESVSEAVLLKWHKNDGDVVQADEPLCELETDKANVDLPAPGSGVIKRLKNEGDKVHIGDTIATIEPNGKAVEAPAPKQQTQQAAAAPKPQAPSSKPEDLSPAVRKMVA